MDDLVAHFGGLSPLELYPHAARTSILVPLHAQTNAPPVESSLIPHITATPDGYIESHAVLSSPSASAQPSTGTSPSFPLGYDSTADLTPLRELLLRRTATPPARSNDIVTESMPKMDNDAESGYILHFRDKDVASQNSTPTPRPPRNLLNDLVASNTDSASVEDRTPSEPNDSISRRGSNYDQEPLRSGDLSVTDEDSSTLEQHYQELAFQEQHAPSKERQGEGIDYTPEASGISGVTHGHTPGGAKSSPDGTDFEQGNDVHQILRRWHQQDMERDRLLNGLREEIQDLKRALQAEARRPRATYMSSNWHDNNRRAEAAERTLMEAQQDMQRNPFACVLIDGEGYDFYEDLLQCGKTGGVEAASRLVTEVQDYFEKFRDGRSWDIKVQFYLNANGLLAKCFKHNVRVSEGTLRAFMCGFTQAELGPLIDIVDIGEDAEKACRKVESSFHLFASNVHCQRILFGCCHNRAYATALEQYLGNPIIGSRITLLVSTDHDDYFDSLPFERISLRQVFRPGPFSTRVILAGHYSDSSNPIPYDTFSLPTNEIPSVNLDISLSPSAGPSDEVDTAMAKLEAVTKWQQSANDGTGASPSRRSTFTPFNDWTKLQEQILLNVNDERVDLPAPEENLAVKQRMQARMREKNYCAFFHLLDSCGYERIGKPCKYRHGPKLDKEEIVILKNHTRSLPCKVGSNCRNTECFFGHSCQGQPKCFFGSRCHLAKFHNVEPTVIRVWHPSKADRRT